MKELIIKPIDLTTDFLTPEAEVLEREGLSITFCSSAEGIRPSDFPTQEEVEELYRLTHPLMPDELLEMSAARFFKEPPSDLGLMDLIYLRDRENRVAAGAFSRTLLKDDEEKDGKIVSYCCYRLVHPELQGKGIGKLISRLVLDVVNPDILLSFTTQTSSYHSWRSVVNELGNRYILYPR